MTDEPMYEQVKKDTGVDPDKIVTDGIARANSETGKHTGAYAEDMETQAEVPESITPEPEPEPELETARVLTLKDRCDVCNAAALGYAENKDGKDLLFCGHHIRQFEENLVKQGFEVHILQEVS